MKKWYLWVVLLICAILAIWISGNIVTQKTMRWNGTSAFQKSQIEGAQYALSVFFKQHYPDTKQHKIMNGKDLQHQLEKNNNNAILFAWRINKLDAGQQEQLLDWVKKGNHVVLSTLDEDSPLLKDLSIDIKMGGKDVNPLTSNHIQAACKRHYQALHQQYPEEEKHIDSGSQVEKYCYAGLIKLTLKNQQKKHTIHVATDTQSTFSFHYRGAPENVIWQEGNALSETAILRVRYGKGSVVLMNSFDIFSIPQIPTQFKYIGLTHFDNPYLAAYLANEKSHIYYLSQFNPNPKISLLPPWLRFIQNYPLISLAVFLLLTALIWHQIIQTGRKKQISQLENRQLYSHLYAQGLFLWRYKQQRNTLIELQKNLWIQWQKKLNAYPQLNLEQKVNILHSITGIGKSDLALWLKPIAKEISTVQWLHYIRAHQRIRKFS